MNKLKILFSSYLIFLTLIGCGKNEETEINVGGSGSGTITGTTAKLDVEKAGTLTNLIPEDKKYTITNLVLSGELNGTDIKFIREMVGCDVDGETTAGKLSNLDLTDINIVTGGEPYYVLSSSSTYNSQKNTITSYMFYKCNSLNHIKLPNSVTNVEMSSFKECSELTSVTIGNSVTNIGGWAFEGCTGLKEFIVDSNNTAYSSSDGILFNKEQTTLIKCPEGKTGEYTIPNNITSIEAGAFSGCTGLTSITIPNNITSIEAGAFSGCTGLTSITIPNNVTFLDYTALADCKGLIEIHCLSEYPPETRYYWEDNSFFRGVDKQNCKLYIPKGSFGSYKYGVYGWKEFKNIIEVEDINNPTDDSTLKINVNKAGQIQYLISNNKKNLIKNLKLTGEINGIDINFIREMAGIDAQGNETEGKLVNLDISECDIVDGGNSTCTTVTNEISNFSKCKLTSIILPNSVTYIGSRAFSGCTGLTSITIGNNVTSIGDSAFSGCTGLTSIIIPNNVEIIGWFTFSGCTNLVSITIGNSMADIRGLAFVGCTELIEIHCLAKTPPSTNTMGTFDNIKAECKLYVPIGCSEAYKTADEWKTFENIIEE